MKTKYNLSNRRIIEPRFYDVRDNPIKFYPEEDVKEFIRLLEEDFDNDIDFKFAIHLESPNEIVERIKNKINEYAGPKLVEVGK